MKEQYDYEKKIWTIIVSTITFLGLFLGVITQGFQVWDKFSLNREVKSHPIIDFRTESYDIDCEKYEDLNIKTIGFTIQTSKGAYQILDSIRVDTVIVTDHDFFNENYGKANCIVTDITIDNMILDEKNPKELGFLKFKNNFMFIVEKFPELWKSKNKRTIGKLVLSVPYKFENEVYKIKKEIPIRVYYE